MSDISHIHTSGGLLSQQFVESLRKERCSHPYVKPESYAILNQKAPSPRELEENIATTWELLIEHWEIVRNKLYELDIGMLRTRWVLPFFLALDYEPQFQRKDIIVGEDFRFPLSHRGWIDNDAPFIHTVLPTQNLDKKIEKGRAQKSPHDIVQTFLNISQEHLWGVVTNGIQLRILRDFHHTYTKGYIEFDLESIFETKNYSDFRALYRLCHASRFVQKDDGISALEHFYKDSLAAGVAVGRGLEVNVREAIETLGNGFLTGELIQELQNNEEKCKEFYAEILIIIYRILFLLFAEQRGMMPGRNSLYAESYSMARLREKALTHIKLNDYRNDFWEGLKVTFKMVQQGVLELGIFGYNGMLFSDEKTPLLNTLACRNSELLKAIRSLTSIKREKVLQRISYSDLGVEEIGAIYESLLAFTPRVTKTVESIEGKDIPAHTFFLDPRSTGRKTTGSYYTNPRLVNELIKSALKPVFEDKIKSTGNDKESQAKAVLSIKVCDPACGSAAFLIAATNFLGQELAKIRTEESYPPEKEIRKAKRDVLAHCIYGVDLNPMAVELAKVSLWINCCVEDMPLNFLDHHIRCGNSLIGTTEELINKGIPDNAFDPVIGDDIETARKIKKQNREERIKRQYRFITKNVVSLGDLPQSFSHLTDIEEMDSEDVEQKREEYEKLVQSTSYLSQKFLADLWTSIFFWEIESGNENVPTWMDFEEVKQNPYTMSKQLRDKVKQMAEKYKFFHWYIEFPDVFFGDNPGFNCVLGNPPWERIKLQKKEFFAYKAPEIATASNASLRKKMIKELKTTNTELYIEYYLKKRYSECESKFLRQSNKYPFTAKGDINTYMVFAGLSRQLINGKGRVGVIVPSGIATDDTTKEFFQLLIDKKSLISLFDFENSKGIFPEVHRSYKFCFLTVSGINILNDVSDFSFFSTEIDDLNIEENQFALSKHDIELINPNTKTCPIFRTWNDAELTKKIYKKIPIFIRESESRTINPWEIKFLRMFDMTNDAHLFKTREELENKGFQLDGNKFKKNEEYYLPLYEQNLIHIYDHRYATFISDDKSITTSHNQHLDSDFSVIPRFWINNSNAKNVMNNKFGTERWLIGHRLSVRTTDIRSIIVSVIPWSGVGNSIICLVPEILKKDLMYLLVANFNTIVFDFVARQKIGGLNLNYFITRQLPVLPPDLYPSDIFDNIKTKVLELVYTAYDLKPFAEDMGYHGPPFKWDEERREILIAELEAIYAHLYGVTEEELDYILETFPIVKRKDIEKYGEYRTKRLILEFYNKYRGEI